jgi:murein DD-endopeptidase MepM/ murein hydrolase activator NlpD
MSGAKQPLSTRKFNIISWTVTAIIVAITISAGIWFIDPFASPTTTPPEIPTRIPGGQPSTLPALDAGAAPDSIAREISLKTNMPERPNYDVVKYKVVSGDSLFGIADQYKLDAETVYWANQDIFQGSPDNIHIGDVLNIPPKDGVYYKWEEGDTLEAVAKKYEVDAETIVNWPGNKIDLTNPTIPAGTYVMIPGGKENDQPIFIQTVSRYNGPCGAGLISRGFFTWPAPNHYISGYDYGLNGHHGIDIAAPEGTPVYAADTGVVTMASIGDWNHGYGNVIQIDHGNGFVTLYAHLSQVYVSPCLSVYGGATIGAAGNTGNSFGAHLHFEIRFNGVAVNPWDYLP